MVCSTAFADESRRKFLNAAALAGERVREVGVVPIPLIDAGAALIAVNAETSSA